MRDLLGLSAKRRVVSRRRDSQQLFSARLDLSSHWLRLASDMGADGIELDSSVTNDGAPVVIHDDRVDRTTDGRGAIRDMRLEEVKRFDAGARFDRKFRGEKIPTLAEVLNGPGKRGIVNTELKSGKLPNVGLETGNRQGY